MNRAVCFVLDFSGEIRKNGRERAYCSLGCGKTERNESMKDKISRQGSPEKPNKSRRMSFRISALLTAAALLTLAGTPRFAPVSGAAGSSGTTVFQPMTAFAEELPLSAVPHYADRFYLRNMAPELQRDAAAIYQGIAAFQSEIVLPDRLDPDSISRILSALRYDCPELFQVDFGGRYSMKTRNGAVYSVILSYGMGPEEYSQMLSRCRELLAQLARNAESAGQAAGEFRQETVERYVYEALTDWIAYSTDAPNCANAGGALLGRAAKCDGISLAMKWAMEELGIPALVLSGQDPADPSGHAWNCVQIDGVWYDVDLTNDCVTEDRTMKLYSACNIRREWMTRIYPLDPEIAAYYDVPVPDRMDRSFHVLNGSFVPAGADAGSIFFTLLDAAAAGSGEGPGLPAGAGTGTGLIQFESDADYQAFLENYGNYLNEWFSRRARGGSFELVTKTGFRTAGFRLTVQ